MQTPLARRVLRQRRRNKLSKFGNELEERIPRYTSRETPRGLSKDKLFEATRPNRRKPLRAQEYWKEHTFFSLPTLKSLDLNAGLRGRVFADTPHVSHSAHLLYHRAGIPLHGWEKHERTLFLSLARIPIESRQSIGEFEIQVNHLINRTIDKNPNKNFAIHPA